MTASESWYLYLIECDDGRLYAGITNNLIKRFKTHLSGRGAFFTKVNHPVRFIGHREYPNHSIAAKAEAMMKKCDRTFKIAWAEANPVDDAISEATLQLLAKSALKPVQQSPAATPAA